MCTRRLPSNLRTLYGAHLSILFNLIQAQFLVCRFMFHFAPFYLILSFFHLSSLSLNIHKALLIIFHLIHE